MIEPALCKLRREAFTDTKWRWGRKYDGARILAFVNGSNVRLQARSGTDKTKQFPELRIRAHVPCILDGEVAHINNIKFQEGTQPRINRIKDIDEMAKKLPQAYRVFDILEANGRDLRQWLWWRRQNVLTDILHIAHNVTLVKNELHGKMLFRQAERNDWEGIVGKHIEGTYIEGKRDWIKVKVWQTDIFNAVGYTKGTGKRSNTFGAIVLQFPATGLYAGKAGSVEMTDEQLFDFSLIIRHPVAITTCPWDKPPLEATWIKPFPVKVKYLELTNAGRVRHGTVL